MASRLLACCAGPMLGGAAAAGALAVTPARAQPTTQELQQELDKRDAVIKQLIQRVDALERQARRERATPKRTAQAERPAPVPQPAVPSVLPPPITTPPTQITPQIAPPPTVAAQPAAPETKVSEAVIARALENSLVDQGGLLLPPYVAQFVPDFSFAYQSTDQLAFVGLGAIGNTSTGPFTQRSHRDLLEWGLGFRLGLPYETQVSIRVPFDLDLGQATFAGTTTRYSNAGGLGDISLAVQKQVWHEKGWQPDVLLSASYKAATGSTSLAQAQVSTFPFAVGTGSGFNSLTGGITALKRQDPLVFLGQVFYTHNFPATIAGVSQTPGDAFEYRISVNLAASPDTSLRFAWDTTFQEKATFGGVTSPGSQQTFSFLEVGVGSVLTPRLFLDAALDIGLTRDSPDFRAMLTLPFRF